MIPDHSRDHLKALGKSGSAFQSDRDFRRPQPLTVWQVISTGCVVIVALVLLFALPCALMMGAMMWMMMRGGMGGRH